MRRLPDQEPNPGARVPGIQSHGDLCAMEQERAHCSIPLDGCPHDRVAFWSGDDDVTAALRNRDHHTLVQVNADTKREAMLLIAEKLEAMARSARAAAKCPACVPPQAQGSLFE